MPNTRARFYFDFVDPLSYLQELELKELELKDLELAETTGVERIGFELAPPPTPLTSVHEERWRRRYAEARALPAAAGVTLAPPSLVPWTRKAHELHALAREGEGASADAMRRAIFEAYFVRGEDIGRVDRLVAIAVSLGLDRTAVKAALDVDRYQEDVVRARQEATEVGIVDTPSMALSDGILRGFHNREALGSLLRGS
jgi:predicted DsbA family dithiol-disulfide isomerase